MLILMTLLCHVALGEFSSLVVDVEKYNAWDIIERECRVGCQQIYEYAETYDTTCQHTYRYHLCYVALKKQGNSRSQ